MGCTQKAYNPSGNGQCERFNGIIWQTTLCILAQKQAHISDWPNHLGEALHCIRSLQCSSTSSTPHNLFLSFDRRIAPFYQPVIPVGNFAWLRRFVRHKNDSSGELVQIVAAYPEYAIISRSSTEAIESVS